MGANDALRAEQDRDRGAELDSHGLDLASCPTPVGRTAMVQWWDELTFIHWRYRPDLVQRLLPKGLEVETMDGSAWIGLVPFFLRVGFPHVPSVPWMTRFAETNLRTYVRSADGERGVWFFSLDAARLGAVLTARLTYRIPYFWSRMRLEHDGATVSYECRRRWPGPRGARSSAVVAIGDRYEPSDLSELDHFLTARWSLYSAPLIGLHRARVHHEPWPLYRAHLVRFHDELIVAAGMPEPEGTPLVHSSPSVEVLLGWPHRVRSPRT